MKVNLPITLTAADTQTRTLTGRIVTWGEEGFTSAGKTIFAKDSITIPKNVKLLLEHDRTRPIGKLTNYEVTDSGIEASFKIAGTIAGDDSLLEAAEGLRDGFSVGIKLNEWENVDGAMVISSSQMIETSLVTDPAIDSARVSEVAASETEVSESNDSDIKPEGEDLVSETVSESVTTEAVEAAKSEVTVSASAPVMYSSPRVNLNVTAGQYAKAQLAASRGDNDARDLIAALQVATVAENTGMVPPNYLRDVIGIIDNSRPFIDSIERAALPASGMTINVPSLVTSAGGGTGVAPTVTVEAEAGAVSNTGMETAYLTGTVSKYSGMNTLSVELLERSDPNFYAELTQQLQNAYLKTIDTTVLTALLAAGMNGTDTTADLDGIVAFTTEGAREIYSNTGYFAQNYIANPAQWGALIGAQDSTKRPVFNALQPMNAAGQVGPQSIRGSVLGLDLYVDKNFSATTFDDDSAVILAPEAFTVYRSAQNYMSVNVVSNLQVQVAIYGYMATIAKMPNGIIKYKKT